MLVFAVMESKTFSAANPNSIQAMFASIAKRYDLANMILSLGIHQIWKKILVRKALKYSPHRILDCATGTGDLAFLFEAQAKKQKREIEILGSDFCEAMLEVARKKASRKKSSLSFQKADLMKLPQKSSYYDIACVSFGIRNVQNPKIAIQEMTRVLKPEGKLMVLEFGQIQVPFLSHIYRLYSSYALPYLGALISGEKNAYRYLESSSASFPSAENFVSLALAGENLKHLWTQRLQFGIAYIYCFSKKK